MKEFDEKLLKLRPDRMTKRELLYADLPQTTKDHFLHELEVRKEHKSKERFWTLFSVFIAFPAVLVAGVVAYVKESEHLKHLDEHPPEYIPYSYLNILNKKFPWGDGTKGLFHSKYNDH